MFSSSCSPQLGWHRCNGMPYEFLSEIVTAVSGYEYWVCVGYDAGDLYYDDASTLEELRNLFSTRVSGPLHSDGIVARVVFMR